MAFNNLFVPYLTDSQGRPSAPALTLRNQVPLDLTPYTTLLDAIQACSSCNMQAAAVQIGATTFSSGGASSNPLSTDVCKIQLYSGSYTGWLPIPGPVDAMFKSDGVTLDLSSTIVVNLQSAVVGILGDVAGNAWMGFAGGKRGTVTLGPGGQ